MDILSATLGPSATAATPDPAELLAATPALIERLGAEGIHTLAAWRALGRKRLELFGVTRALASQLDTLAKAAQP